MSKKEKGTSNNRKYKTEKIAIPPFDTYRANFQNCIMKNSNLRIIGYGFSDYYINNSTICPIVFIYL